MKRRRGRQHLSLVRPAADARRLGQVDVWLRVGGERLEEPSRPEGPVTGKGVALRRPVGARVLSK
jgi:hypothetical protein